MWHGQTDLRQGILFPPNYAYITGVDKIENTTISHGLYFWHPASSQDAQWVIRNINLPDLGFQDMIHSNPPLNLGSSMVDYSRVDGEIGTNRKYCWCQR